MRVLKHWKGWIFLFWHLHDWVFFAWVDVSLRIFDSKKSCWWVVQTSFLLAEVGSPVCVSGTKTSFALCSTQKREKRMIHRGEIFLHTFHDGPTLLPGTPKMWVVPFTDVPHDLFIFAFSWLTWNCRFKYIFSCSSGKFKHDTYFCSCFLLISPAFLHYNEHKSVNL